MIDCVLLCAGKLEKQVIVRKKNRRSPVKSKFDFLSADLRMYMKTQIVEVWQKICQQWDGNIQWIPKLFCHFDSGDLNEKKNSWHIFVNSIQIINYLPFYYIQHNATSRVRRQFKMLFYFQFYWQYLAPKSTTLIFWVHYVVSLNTVSINQQSTQNIFAFAF
jgi:hypothetical protein